MTPHGKFSMVIYMTMLICLVDAVPYKTYIRFIQVELVEEEGLDKAQQLLEQAMAKYFNIAQQAHWLAMWKVTNQLHHVNNVVIISDWAEPIGLLNLEFLDRTL